MKIAQFQQFIFKGCDVHTTVDTSGNPWFQAGDVSKVRALANSRHALILLEQETRSAQPRAQSAFHFNREQQPLRLWSKRNSGPAKCLRMNGHLGWLTDTNCKLLGG